MPPVVLAGASEGQTNAVFERRAGRSSAAAKSISSESCSHVVVAGDTLGQIASDKLGTATRWREIIAANPGLKPNALQIGTVLNLPCTVAGRAEEGGAEKVPPDRVAFLQRLRNALSKPASSTAAAPDAAGSDADVEEAAEETPALPPPPVWTAAQDEFLADVLTRWGNEAGWTVIVDTTDAWRLKVGFRTEGAFDAAVAELIRGMGHDGLAPRVRLYPNQVLRLGGPL